MKNRYIKTLVLVAAFLILSLVTSASYAYFVANVKGNESVYDTVITSGDLRLEFYDGDQVSLNNAYPTQRVEKSFVVYNSGNMDTTYDVYLSEIINTFADKNDLVYYVDSISNYVHNTEYFEDGCSVDGERVVPSEVGEESKIFSACSISAGKAHAYTIIFYFKDDETNQDDNKGKKFKGKISINDYKEAERVAELVDGPTFNQIVSELSVESARNHVGVDLDAYCASQSGFETSGLTCEEYYNSTLLSTINDGKLYIRALSISNTKISDLPSQILENVTIMDVSSDNSDDDIYAFVYNGILYIGSENPTIYMNENSSYMFSNNMGYSSFNLEKLNASRVKNMYGMFYNSYYIQAIDFGNSFDTSDVTTMEDMFFNCANITSINFGNNFNTGNVKNMSGMFYNLQSMESIDLGSNFDTSNVSDMKYMFYNMKNLKSLDLGDKFNTGRVSNMNRMFESCEALESLDLGSNFDTSNVSYMRSMFAGLNNVASLDLGDKFDTSKVTTMQSMFASMHALTDLNLGNNFDTSNVTNMQAMFTWLTSIRVLDLGPKFNTSKVTSLKYMMNYCTELETVYVPSDFAHPSSYSAGDMFMGSTKLKGGAGTTYTDSHRNGEYARIDNPSGNKAGYFTLRTN